MTAHVCGIDIGKTVFHLIGLSKEGQIVAKRRFTRKQLIIHTVNMPACLIGMEACPGAHYLARVLRAQGHEVKLMPAEYVRPSSNRTKTTTSTRKLSQKLCNGPRCDVPIKSEAQLDLQALHRVRDRWMGRRTAVINQIRGFLLEHGITIAVGPAHLKRQIPSILEDADNLLSPRMRALLVELRDEWEKLETQIEEIDREFSQVVKKEEKDRKSVV